MPTPEALTLTRRLGFLEPAAGVEVKGWASGEALPLHRALEVVLGRSVDATYVLTDDHVARRHMRFSFDGARWHVEDHGTTNGTQVNGVSVRRHALVPGDVVRLGRSDFRFVERETTHLSCPQLEAALAERPEEDARWGVYADWLLERGEPFGARLSGAAQEDDAVALEVLASEPARGTLALEWRRGCVVGATLRPERGRAPAAAAYVGALGGLPVARFLQRLRVWLADAAVSFPGVPSAEQQLLEHADAVGAALRRTGPWPALRRLEVAPAWSDAFAARLVRALGEPAGACPRLEGSAAACVVRYADAWIDVEAAPPTQDLLVPGARARLSRDRPLQLAGARIAFGEAGWELTSAAGATGWTVNGAFAAGFLGRALCPGDVVAHEDGLRAVFGAERVGR